MLSVSGNKFQDRYFTPLLQDREHVHARSFTRSLSAHRGVKNCMCTATVHFTARQESTVPCPGSDQLHGKTPLCPTPCGIFKCLVKLYAHCPGGHLIAWNPPRCMSLRHIQYSAALFYSVCMLHSVCGLPHIHTVCSKTKGDQGLPREFENPCVRLYWFVKVQND